MAAESSLRLLVQASLHGGRCSFWAFFLVIYVCALGLVSSAEEARQRALDREFPASAFDVLAIAPRIQSMRHDYIATTHISLIQRELLRGAPRQVRNLSCFRQERHEHEMADATSVS